MDVERAQLSACAQALRSLADELEAIGREPMRQAFMGMLLAHLDAIRPTLQETTETIVMLRAALKQLPAQN